MTSTEIALMTDQVLVAATNRAAIVERQSTRDLLALLIELEHRKLRVSLGYSSLFAYCTRALQLSEQAAYSRITAARAARRFPVLLDKLAEGSLTLSSGASASAALLLEPMLDAVSDSAPCAPESAIPTRVFTPPTPSRPQIAPLTSRTYLLKMTINQETYDKLQRARALLRHVVPGGHPVAILDRALTVLLEKTESAKFAAVFRKGTDDSNTVALTAPPKPASASVREPARPSSRYIPASVRRTVWNRDGGRCVFRGSDGECGETGFLEFHHVVPFAAGGRSDVTNLELRCRAHNAFEADLFFGPEIDCDTRIPPTRRAPS